MENQEAIKIIQERIKEMVINSGVQKTLIDMKNNGNTEEECRTWLTNVAIATLIGIK